LHRIGFEVRVSQDSERGSRGDYRRHFLFPMLAVLTTAGAIMIGLLVWLTVVADSQEAAQEADMARLVVTARLDFLRQNQSDYATWDDAVERLVRKLDPEWASDNIGPYLFQTQGYEHSFVIDGRNRTIYASDGNRPAGLDAFATMGPALGGLLADLRRSPPGRDVRRTGLAIVRGRLAAFSIAAIIPHPGKVRLPAGPASYLLFVDILSPDQLAELGRERGLAGLTFAGTSSPGRSGPGTVYFPTIDAGRAGVLSWNSSRPGTVMRSRALPVLMALILALAYVAARVLRRCRVSLQHIRIATDQSAADARDAREALAALTQARGAAAAAEAEARTLLEGTVAQVRRENDALVQRAAATRAAALAGAREELDRDLAPVLTTLKDQGRMLATASERMREQAHRLGALVTAATASVGETQRGLGILVPEATSCADAGVEIDTDAASALADVRTASADARRVGGSVQALAASLDDVDTVVDAIDALAKQTNMLALNARIEAARAGEAGAGFGVVAREIKVLADGTSELTRRVTDQLETLRTRSADTLGVVGTIGTAMDRTERASEAITGAVRRQVDGVARIRGGIGQVADASRATASAVSDARSAVAAGHEAADRMDEVAMQLSETLRSLDAGVTTFVQHLESA